MICFVFLVHLGWLFCVCVHACLESACALSLCWARSPRCPVPTEMTHTPVPASCRRGRSELWVRPTNSFWHFFFLFVLFLKLQFYLLVLAHIHHLPPVSWWQLVPAEEYERWLQRGLSVAESRCEGSYHCATPDCLGWCVYEDTVNVFHCPVCKKHNCLICKVEIIHSIYWYKMKFNNLFLSFVPILVAWTHVMH